MPNGTRACIFCSATADLVPVGVLDLKWCHRFGGDPVVSLDHGWYTTVRGLRRDADHIDPARYFGPHVRAVCDYCAHGWLEDLQWRAEPALLSLAECRPASSVGRDWDMLRRWAAVTAVLGERVSGMPLASSPGQRDALRTGRTPELGIGTWFFLVRQRLPARVHLSQVPTPNPVGGMVQVLSVDLAHLSVLVVLPSDLAAQQLVERSELDASLPGNEMAPPAPRPLDLSQTPHPHRVAVQRLCSTSRVATG